MSNLNDYITICELMRTHGVKGYIKAKPLTHDLSRHAKLKAVKVVKSNGQILDLELEDSSQAATLWLLKFKGFDTPEATQALVNGEVLIPETERIPAPEGEFYLDELEGLHVQTEKGEDVGEIIEVLELATVTAFNIRFNSASQNAYSNKPILAPWIDDCVKEIRKAENFIVCDADYLKALCPSVHDGKDGEA